MSSTPVFGIDLGTTYSCISYVDEFGKPVIIPNAEGEMTTPSVVYFESPDSLVVGKTAKEHSDIFPDRVVSCVKRGMGSETWIFECDGRTYKPQEVAAFIIRKLVADTRSSLGLEVREVVITCPAYFGVNQKEATRQAGQLAGLTVRYIIPEPTAAALAYLAEKKTNQTVLVYDLGGGTFDVTLMTLQDGEITVLATGGDDKLGGRNWDEAIVDYFVDAFCAATGADPASLYDDMEIYQELITSAELCKKSLSSQNVFRKNIRTGEHKAQIELTRETFDNLTAPLFLRTVAFTEDMFAEAAARGCPGVDNMLLVGGSTYMPQVLNGIREHFGSRCDILQYHPNQAVAEGAALFGQELAAAPQAQKRQPVSTDAGGTAEAAAGVAEAPAAGVAQAAADRSDVAASRLHNVTSRGFGIVVMTEHGPRVRNLIYKNDPLPCVVDETFGTWEDGQPNVELRLMENPCANRDVTLLETAFCTELSTALLELDTALPAQSPVNVRFTFADDGLLTVEAHDLTHGRSLACRVETESLMDAASLDDAQDKHAAMRVR